MFTHTECVRWVHCDASWFFPARRIVLPSECQRVVADSAIHDDMIRLIPVDVDFTANGVADTGGGGGVFRFFLYAYERRRRDRERN